MGEKDSELTTADIANPRDEMRGQGDERIVDRAAGDPGMNPSGQTPAPRGAAESPAGAVRDSSRPAPAGAGEPPVAAVLFPTSESERLRAQWSEIQVVFVDAPRQAVERADILVAEVMKRLAEGFANERANLERQWDRGDNVTTEDLRVALQRYRAFFDRLLTV